MRNTLAHPITKEEILLTLRRLEQKDIDSEVVGSTDAIVLQGLQKLVEDLDPVEIEKYIKH